MENAVRAIWLRQWKTTIKISKHTGKIRIRVVFVSNANYKILNVQRNNKKKNERKRRRRKERKKTTTAVTTTTTTKLKEKKNRFVQTWHSIVLHFMYRRTCEVLLL